MRGEAVTITELADTYVLSADCLPLIGTSIPAGGSVSCTYEVPHTVPGTYPNTASVTVKDSESNTASASASASVEVTSARLTLVKEVRNDDGGAAAPTEWVLTAAGLATISGASGDASVTGVEVPPGAYVLSESGGPAGYSTLGWSCVGGALSSGSVTLAAGDSATCTITNDDVAPKLTLVKVVKNDHGGSAVPSDFPLFVSGSPVTSGVATSLTANTPYLAAEAGRPGYVASSWLGDCALDGSITLQPGDEKVCTITNDDLPPSLTLVKHVVNDNGGTATPADWTLSASGPTPISGLGGTTSGLDFHAGAYELSEAGPAGYAASAWSCSGGVQSGSTITLAPGEAAVCAITNDDKPPYLKLAKKVVNAWGGLALPDAWTVSAAGPTPISGAGGAESGALFAQGTYTLSEGGGVDGYLAGAWSCAGGTQAGDAITVGLGEAAVCTITNGDQPGHATLLKTVLGLPPSGSQDFTFQLRQGASPITVGSILEAQHANAGNGGSVAFATNLRSNTTYQLCEIVMPGWLTTLGSFVPDSFIPPDGVAANPNVDNSILCVDFTLASGQTLSFTVDNTPPPGGRALTIGFWKNWASCASSNGKGQAPILDRTLAAAEPAGVVCSATSGNYPAFGPTIYLVLHGSAASPDAAPDCRKAVALLNKSTLDTGKKMASDPAFNLPAQLVAAELNYVAGAGRTPAATTAINEAVLLLGKVRFNGVTHAKIGAADAARMNQLAVVLDGYNNNR